MELVVTGLRVEAEGVLGVELRSLSRAALPGFEPGAHVDVALPNGLTRQYSIASSAADTGRYCLGIGLAPASRGGSRYAHEQLRLGDRLQVGPPRSLFRLETSATGHLFVAGGIGITPILSMIRSCVDHGLDWRLVYCVRSRGAAAYLDRLASHAERVIVHADDEHSGARVDLGAALRAMPAGWHVYCCGPAPMMDALSQCAEEAGIESGAVHFERFGADTDRSDKPDGAFEVSLLRQGGRFTIPTGESILSVLEANGLSLPSACREGLCRSCEVPLVSGAADHRDYVLSEDERAANQSILICVSRAQGEELVLDI